MRAYKLVGCRAGNDELEDADLGTSQLQEGAAKVEISKPLHKIMKTSRYAVPLAFSLAVSLTPVPLVAALDTGVEAEG